MKISVEPTKKMKSDDKSYRKLARIFNKTLRKRAGKLPSFLEFFIRFGSFSQNLSKLDATNLWCWINFPVENILVNLSVSREDGKISRPLSRENEKKLIARSRENVGKWRADDENSCHLERKKYRKISRGQDAGKNFSRKKYRRDFYVILLI